jgi:hypothetical protein
MTMAIALALVLLSGQPVDSATTTRDLTEIEGRLATAG